MDDPRLSVEAIQMFLNLQLFGNLSILEIYHECFRIGFYHHLKQV